MKLTLLFPIIINVTTVFGVLENNKVLIKELETIERTQRECREKNPAQEEACHYKCALDKIYYDFRADPQTQSYRDFCKKNVTTIQNECDRDQEFVFCLNREVQNEYNKIRDKCVDEFQTNMQAYRNAGLRELIENQSYACFMFCYQKGVGNMNDDLTWNVEYEDIQKKNFNAPLAIECAKSSNVEVTQCSKAAHRIYCLQEKLHS